MYYHQYDKPKFFVKYSYSEWESKLDIEIIMVLKLGIEDEGSEIVIEPNKWRNIALTSICSDNINKLLNQGALTVKSTHLYNDELDATIQMAYICSKYMIEPEDIYEVSQGRLTTRSYKKLLKSFYDDFPEKYI